MSVDGYNFFSGSQEEINRRLYYLILSSGGEIVVDDYLSEISTNPVQNKIITNALEHIVGPTKTSDLTNDGEDGNNPFIDERDIVDKEDKDNKITAWNSTPSDDKYPSEKLAKDSIDEMIVTIEKQGTPESGFSSTYVIKQGGTPLVPKINIPKDFVIKSVNVEVCIEPNVPVQGLEPGDKYIDFIINVNDGGSEEQHIYLAVKDFGCIGDDVTLVLENGIMSIKDGGVNTIQLHDGAVTYAKLSNDLVIDNLTTDDSTKMLSAKQGKVLEDSKIPKSDIVDNLTTNDGSKVLSAKQGKVLEDKKIDKVDIVDDLITDDSTKVLSAKQGKLLYDYIGNIEEDMLL